MLEPPAQASPAVDLSFSIVSHGQGALIKNLLSDFERAGFIRYEILITLNVPEDETFLEAFRALPVNIIRNSQRKGFGHNHNDAFAQSLGQAFIIVNPDIRFHDQPFDQLWKNLRQPRVGCCAPLVMSPAGLAEDSARAFPSLTTIIKRFLLGAQQKTVDYSTSQDSIAVDWTAGMFIAFNRQAYQAVNGFDQGYFMYYEDVDICMRLKFAGCKVMIAPQVQVIHDAQRTSRKKLSYFRWHFVSALRFTIKYFFLKRRHLAQ